MRGQVSRLVSILFLMVCFAAAAVVALVPGKASAMPSFARQTGLACSACHTVYPELTPLGRRFKLHGFTWTPKEAAVSAVTETGESALSLSAIPPLTLLLQATETHYNKSLTNMPAGNLATLAGPAASGKVQQDLVMFPQQVSLAYAGRIADHLGAWIQLTYLQNTGSVGIDTSELRYSDHTANNDLVWGAFVNNTPTFEDVYNTGGTSTGPPFGGGEGETAFGIPYFPTAQIAFPPTPQLLKLVGGGTVGAGVYGFYKDSVYFEVAGYHAAIPGVKIVNEGQNAGGALQSMAPYVRLTYEKDWGQNSWEVGFLGMDAQFSSPGATHFFQAGNFLDYGLDTQYQYIGDEHILTASGMWLHESQSLDNSLVGVNYSNKDDNLDRLSMTASYYYHRKYGVVANYWQVNGSSDALLYGGGGSPSSRGEMLEVDYLPWQNTKFFLQYDFYNSLPVTGNLFATSVSTNHPSDNDTAIAGFWIAF